jgi:hypothetical protein
MSIGSRYCKKLKMSKLLGACRLEWEQITVSRLETRTELIISFLISHGISKPFIELIVTGIPNKSLFSIPIMPPFSVIHLLRPTRHGIRSQNLNTPRI